MTTTDTAPPASTEEKHASIKLVTDHAQRIFQWNYCRERNQLDRTTTATTPVTQVRAADSTA